MDSSRNASGSVAPRDPWKGRGLDVAALHDSTGGDRAFELELLDMFKEASGEHVTALRSALLAGNKKDSYFRAHSIKLGASKLPTLCVEMEKQIDQCSEGDVAALAALAEKPYADLQASYAEYVATFMDYLKSPQ